MIRRLYSQAGQDLWVMRDVFGHRTGGYFVDIGAADGVELSNTCALERYLGWSGICVEAYPGTFAKLQRNRRCRSLNLCLDAQRGTVQFTAGQGFFGGIVAEDTDNTVARDTVSVRAVTFADLIQEHGVPPTIDYLSIDVEGAEDRVMSTFPFATHRFLAATIERPGDVLRQTLAREGYVLVAELPNLDACDLHPEVCQSYNVRARLAAQSRALSPGKRLWSALGWLGSNGLRAASRRI